MKKEFSVLILILLVGGFFRFYQLDRVPPSPSLDEVSIGWNAYSILKTGRDEYGYRFPILLRAYDDWRPALYVYFVIPLVKFFGLSPIVVRLPAALFGTLTVLLTYFLVNELFIKGLKRKNGSVSSLTHNKLIALTTSFLLAISPWHIYISRLGHEVGAGLTFSILGLLFFLKWRLALSAVFFALSFYTYQTQKVFGPLLLVALALIFEKQLLERKKEIILAACLGLFLLIPLLGATLSPGGLARFQGASIFNQQTELMRLSSQRVARDYQLNSSLGLVFDNRTIAMGITFLSNYFSHFDPAWLFFNQGQERHKVPGLGLFYLWELPLILVGAYQLAKGNFPKKTKWLILAWILIGPLPASIATQTPHGMRAFNILPMPQILGSVGAAKLVSSFKRKKVLVLAIIFLVFNLAYFCHNYFVNFPHEQSESFQYPLSEAARYITKIEDQYQKIVFSNQDHCYQSYMFFLFASQYSPEQYLSRGGTISGGFAETHAFDKYEFRPIDWSQEIKQKSTLYVGNIDDFPDGLASLKEFGLLNNQKAIKVVSQ